MRFPECLTKPNAENSFCGFPAAQTWNDLALWEEIFNRYPLGSLIELGAWKGGMALFFAMQCRARGIEFLTVDHDEAQVQCLPLIRSLGGRFVAADLFGSEALKLLAHEIATMPKPLLLFCDNGNKKYEMRAFSPFLSDGDYIAVHDWGSESGPEDIQPYWRPLMDIECEEGTSLTRFFQVCLAP